MFNATDYAFVTQKQNKQVEKIKSGKENKYQEPINSSFFSFPNAYMQSILNYFELLSFLEVHNDPTRDPTRKYSCQGQELSIIL